MGGLSLTHWLVVLVVVLLLFKVNKLPELGSNLGAAITNFKKSMEGKDKTPSDQDKPEQK